MIGTIRWGRTLAAGVGALSAILLAAPAAAIAPSALGWWWVGRPSAMVPPVFSPTPEPPDGGLYVAGGPGGPTGVAALRFAVGTDARATTLELTIAEAEGTPTIDACPPLAPWQPAEDGGWDQRPEPDCETASVRGRVDSAGKKMSFSLSRLPDNGGMIDVVLVPGADPEGQSATGFAVTFSAPGADALAVTERPAPAAPSVFEPAPAEPGVPALPASPHFALPPPLDPADLGRIGEPATLTPDVGPAGEPVSLAADILEPEGYAYWIVLLLPLVLLGGASYLGWALTRPVLAEGPIGP